MAVQMAIRVSATARHSLPPPSSPSPSIASSTTMSKASLKTQFKPIPLSLPTSTTLSLLALFSPPHEPKLSVVAKNILSHLSVSYCDSAKIVARTLTSLGFNNCWVVADGFSGSRGWLQSRLGTDTYFFSLVEVLSPSQVIPTAAKRFGTTSTKFLPGAE